MAHDTIPSTSFKNFNRVSNFKELLKQQSLFITVLKILDIRKIYQDNDLWDNKYDALVYLAAVSNDPMGKKFAEVTQEINAEYCIKVAKEAKNLDQRMNTLYEDMGNILSRYYKIGEITEDEMKQRLGIAESKGDCGCGCGGTTPGGCGDKSVNEESVKVSSRNTDGSITVSYTHLRAHET